jgi:predicted RNA-binding Zn ribbon-like protein
LQRLPTKLLPEPESSQKMSGLLRPKLLPITELFMGFVVPPKSGSTPTTTPPETAVGPEGARGTLSRAFDLREAIHRVISRAIASESQYESDLSVLNRELSVALSHLRVMPSGGAYDWDWDRSGDEGETPLDRPLWPVAQSAAELLTSERLGRVNVCAGDGCGWMFLDESRNNSRRWCDSRDCGNRERVRRHLARKRASNP